MRRTRCTTFSPMRATCGTAAATTSSSIRARATSSPCAAGCATSATSIISFKVFVMDLPVNPNAATEAEEAIQAQIDDPLWYKDVVIYQLHIKAFFDSNDDG